MSLGILIDGKKIAAKWNQQIKDEIRLKQAWIPRNPKLVAILVGENPASQIYVGHKQKIAVSVGIQSEVIQLPNTCSQSQLIHSIETLNQDPGVDGILIQLPLPDSMDARVILDSVHPSKDVDGLGAMNQGLMFTNQKGHRPCTPLGIMHLLSTIGFNPYGKIAAVVGGSNLVGAPLGRMLVQAGATLIQINSKTRDPISLAKMADLLVVATGKSQLVDERWVKKGAVVIDVGIHRDQHGVISGDVQTQKILPIASFVTPVPGGVGPMTIAALMSNCWLAAQRHFQFGVSEP